MGHGSGFKGILVGNKSQWRAARRWHELFSGRRLALQDRRRRRSSGGLSERLVAFWAAAVYHVRNIFYRPESGSDSRSCAFLFPLVAGWLCELFATTRASK